MTPTTAIDEFFTAYLEAALFSTGDDDGQPLDKNYTRDNIKPETLEILHAHCLSFLARALPYIEAEDGVTNRIQQAGHDFWFTSQGHGCGFRDGDWPTHGGLLTELSKHYPSELNLTVTEGGGLAL